VSDVAQRFGSLPWHDSKLLGLSIHRSESEDRVAIRVSLRQPTPSNGKLVDVVFLETTYFEGTVDLEGKRVCADDISTASCRTSSPWLASLAKSNPHDSFEGYLHFEIYLVPPGGLINILARDFALSELTLPPI
jgi:hypothetical protein